MWQNRSEASWVEDAEPGSERVAGDRLAGLVLVAGVSAAG